MTVATEDAAPYDARMTGDDLALVQAMATRDAGSLSEFYDRHAAAVYAACLPLRGHREAAEELLVDSFHSFWHNAAHFDASHGEPLAALLAEVGHRGDAPTPVPPPHELKSELMTRIAREQDAILRHKPIPDPHDPHRRLRHAGQAFAALAAVVFVVVLVNVWTTRRIAGVREEVRNQYKQQLIEKDATIVLMQTILDRDAEVKQVLERAKFRTVELTSDNGKASGRILIDDETHTWYLFAVGLEPQPEGQAYKLWYATADQKKIDAGTFNTDANNVGRLKLSPSDIGQVTGVTITDKHGTTRLAGKPSSP